MQTIIKAILYGRFSAWELSISFAVRVRHTNIQSVQLCICFRAVNFIARAYDIRLQCISKGKFRIGGNYHLTSCCCCKKSPTLWNIKNLRALLVPTNSTTYLYYLFVLRLNWNCDNSVIVTNYVCMIVSWINSETPISCKDINIWIRYRQNAIKCTQ